jgi:hypothetical protein
MQRSTIAVRQYLARDSRRSATTYGAAYFREWSPPQTTSLEETTSFSPLKIFREPSFGEYVAADKSQASVTEEYASFGSKSTAEQEALAALRKPFKRIWTPPHTSSLFEAAAYAPGKLYREPSFGAFIAPSSEVEGVDQEYANFADQSVDLDEGLLALAPAIENIEKQDLKQEGIWHPQDWAFELTTTYAGSSGVAPLRRSKSFASYAGELGAQEVRVGDILRTLDTAIVTNKKGTAANSQPSWHLPVSPIKQNSMGASYSISRGTATAMARQSAIGRRADATYAGSYGGVVAPLNRGKSFASYAGEMEIDDMDTSSTPAVSPTKAAAKWQQPSWHLPVSPMKSKVKSTAALFSSRTTFSKRIIPIPMFSPELKLSTTSGEDPFDDGDGFGWGTPRCPVP